MLIDQSLDWHNPGEAPYTGTYIEWVQRLPEPIRGQMSSLTAKVAARDYDAVIYVNRDRIFDANGKGDYDYAPDITYMASGSRGRVFSSVARTAWSDSDLQSAMVFCTPAGMCAAKFSVCGNWSIVSRDLARRSRSLISSSEGAGYVADAGAPLPAEEGVVSAAPAPSPIAEDVSYVGYFGGGAGYGGGFGGGGGYTGGSGPCVFCPPPDCPPGVTNPIPEPSTLALMLATIGVGAWRIRRKS